MRRRFIDDSRALAPSRSPAQQSKFTSLALPLPLAISRLVFESVLCNMEPLTTLHTDSAMRVPVPQLVRGFLIVFAIASTGASAQTAPPPSPRTVAPDPAAEAARAAFEALPESERKALQEALVWVGDYNGMADGNLGRQTYDALLAFQGRRKGNPQA